jgi:ABC-type nitrate/sulfonate/bicarbonate transport system substrate-binding protein
MTANGYRTRAFFRATACVALVALVPAGVAAASRQEQQRSLETVTIGMLPVEPTMQAAYADARGFFARQGIEAKISVLADPAQIPAAVLSGTVQFSSFSVGGIATLKARGAPIRMIASGAIYRPTAPTTAIVAAPGRQIARARDLAGKTIAIDARNTIAHVGLLKWLKRNGLSADDVSLVELPFAQMIGPLRRGQFDAAVLPEPFLTLATQRGARQVATIFNAVCKEDCLITGWMTRRDTDPALIARFRNAVQAAAVWANKKENQAASGAILARYAPIDKAVIAKMTRTSFAQRLRVAPAQPWIDVYAEFGVIPQSFPAIDLVR